MTHTSTSTMQATSLLIILLALMSGLVWAGPGAHGPNGEHLHSPRARATGEMHASPRIEATSDLFELVGTLEEGEFSILVDRFATNEPVLNARVEIESGELKAKATFHDDIGDYSVDDPAMLRKLQEPGEHPLVITIIAGSDNDLLNAILRTEPTSADHDHHTHWPWWSVIASAIVALLAIAAVRIRNQRQRPSARGDLS